jgi:Fe-S cluster biogenesis protein NfuA
MNKLIESLRTTVRGACQFCSISHKVRDQIEAAGWPLLADDAGEASIRALVNEGRQVLNF